MAEKPNEEPRLYIKKRIHSDGTIVVEAYAYGDPWVQQALLMDDMKFKTPEEAQAWWIENYGKENNSK